MKNKVLVHVVVPDIDQSFDIFIPVNIRIGMVIKLLNSSLVELSKGAYQPNNKRELYGPDSKVYEYNKLLRETDIRHGTNVVFM